MASPIITLETITPEKAKEYLATSITKPKAKDGKGLGARNVRAYATLMSRNKWESWPPITFDNGGHLSGGHHRLSAVILAGVSVKMHIVRGVTLEQAINEDTGRVKPMQELFRDYRPGTDYSNNRSGAVGVCAWLLSGSSQRIRSLTEYDLWVRPFKDGVQWMVREKLPSSVITRAAGVAGALVFAYKANPAKVGRFAQQLMNGDGLKSGSPALTLRNYLTNQPPGRRGGGSYKVVIARQVLNAVRAHLQGEDMLRISTDDGGRQFFLDSYKRATVKTISMSALEE